MKTKTLLLASLLVAALTAQAQTVEYTDANGKSSKSIMNSKTMICKMLQLLPLAELGMMRI